MRIPNPTMAYNALTHFPKLTMGVSGALTAAIAYAIWAGETSKNFDEASFSDIFKHSLFARPKNLTDAGFNLIAWGITALSVTAFTINVVNFFRK